MTIQLPNTPAPLPPREPGCRAPISSACRSVPFSIPRSVPFSMPIDSLLGDAEFCRPVQRRSSGLVTLLQTRT